MQLEIILKIAIINKGKLDTIRLKLIEPTFMLLKLVAIFAVAFKFLLIQFFKWKGELVILIRNRKFGVLKTFQRIGAELRNPIIKLSKIVLEKSAILSQMRLIQANGILIDKFPFLSFVLLTLFLFLAGETFITAIGQDYLMGGALDGHMVDGIGPS